MSKEMQYGTREEDSEKVISLSWIWRRIWESRGLVLAATVLGLILSIGYCILSGPRYEIGVTLIPAESDSENSGILGQLPSFLNLGSDRPLSKFKQFQAALYTDAVAEMMDKRYQALCSIYRDRCDPNTHQWRPKAAWRLAISNILNTLLGQPEAPQIPEPSELKRYIKGHVELGSDGTSLITLTMVTDRADEGRQFLGQLVSVTNDYIRLKDRQSLREYVRYLSDRLARLDRVEQRQSLDTLLMTEERRLMLTEVDVAYAAAPLVQPNSTLQSPLPLVGIGALIGALVGSLMAVLLHLFQWKIEFSWSQPFRRYLAREQQ